MSSRYRPRQSRRRQAMVRMLARPTISPRVHPSDMRGSSGARLLSHGEVQQTIGLSDILPDQAQLAGEAFFMRRRIEADHVVVNLLRTHLHQPVILQRSAKWYTVVPAVSPRR